MKPLYRNGASPAPPAQRPPQMPTNIVDRTGLHACPVCGTCTTYGTTVMADRIPLVFFRTSAGNEPVREWLKALPVEDRQAVGRDLARVQHRWPVGMPLARSLGKGLWEARTNLASRRIARVIFCFHEDELVALTRFIKKTQKTPQDEIDTALNRKKELER
jgi:phage-related protein